MVDDLTAQDVMTDGVIAIDRNASVQDAAQKMQEENIRSLVVLDDGEAVGIVVGRDLVYNVLAEGHGSPEQTVGDVMTGDLVTATEADGVDQIARAMLEHDISRVPILRGDQVVGIVTQSNIIRAWPSYIDLLQEENQLYPLESRSSSVESLAGECAQCDNYAEDLVNLNGEFICPECRAEL